MAGQGEQYLGSRTLQRSSHAYDRGLPNTLPGPVATTILSTNMPSHLSGNGDLAIPVEPQVLATAHVGFTGRVEAIGGWSSLPPSPCVDEYNSSRSHLATDDAFAAWSLHDIEATIPTEQFIFDKELHQFPHMRPSLAIPLRYHPIEDTERERASDARPRGDLFLGSGSGRVFDSKPKRPSSPLEKNSQFSSFKRQVLPLRSGKSSDFMAPEDVSGPGAFERPYQQYQEQLIATQPIQADSLAETSKHAASRDDGGGAHDRHHISRHEQNMHAAHSDALSIIQSKNSTHSPLIPFHIPIFVNAGDHLEIEELAPGSDVLPYKHVRMLGLGGTASVEMVRDDNTGSVYARKIVRNVYTRNMKEARRQLQNEVQIMRRLAAHHHIVKVHATYIAKRELAIILNPVADSGDLASFLQDCRDGLFDASEDLKSRKSRVLHKAFGCLAAGLAFIHEQTIRHKDIKSQNILIHRDEVLYTDFGLSYDFGDSGQSTTTGPVQGLTRRYCAPEVAAGGNRNSKSDVFSLGCVYLEIIDGLYPGSVNEVVLAGPFHEKLRDLSAPQSELWLNDTCPLSLKSVSEDLLQTQSSTRPPASQVAFRLRFRLRINLTEASLEPEIMCEKCAKSIVI